MTEAVPSFDTRQSVDLLVEGGIPVEQAEVIIGKCVASLTAQVEAKQADLATRSELTAAFERVAQLQVESNERIARMEKETSDKFIALHKEMAQMHKEIAQFRAETSDKFIAMHKEIAQMRVDLMDRIAQARAETDKKFSETNERIAQAERRSDDGRTKLQTDLSRLIIGTVFLAVVLIIIAGYLQMPTP